ncbi:MAG: prepilin-type N-terminal cleavage/methylation domain-containing protein [Acidobacteriota bacterium]
MRPSFSLASGYSAIELLVVLALVSTLAAMSVPMSMSMVDDYRLSGDAHSVSNSVALAKMSAAAQFTRARLYVDLNTGQHHVEIWRKTGAPGWVADSGVTLLAPGISFGAGAIGTPPPNSQAAVSQAPACRDNAGAAIASTACVLFNSRGISVDEAGTISAARLLYLAGPTGVFAIVVSGTSQLQVWRISPGGGTWVQQ